MKLQRQAMMVCMLLTVAVFPAIAELSESVSRKDVETKNHSGTTQVLLANLLNSILQNIGVGRLIEK